MSDNVSIPDLERITFFNGQQLTAADLTDLQAANRELRWLHNRSLHNWGIGAGLGVMGERGSRTVTVEPGYGVDHAGREIILTETRVLPVPAIASAAGGQEAVFYIVAAYRADKDQPVTERRPGTCMPEGGVRLREEPLIAWRKPDQLAEGFELILAKAWIKNCQLSRPLCLAVRRNARPSQQPYIVSGQTEAGNTAWTLWQVGNKKLGVQTVVDTSQARFRTTPSYVAHVAGERYLASSPGPLLAIGFSAMVDATPEQFTLQVLLPAMNQVQANVNPASLRNQQAPGIVNTLGWQVVWAGIEA
jgi:hypothetical protein